MAMCSSVKVLFVIYVLKTYLPIPHFCSCDMKQLDSSLVNILKNSQIYFFF